MTIKFTTLVPYRVWHNNIWLLCLLYHFIRIHDCRFDMRAPNTCSEICVIRWPSHMPTTKELVGSDFLASAKHCLFNGCNAMIIYVCCIIMSYANHYSMVVADGMAHIWLRDICNHHGGEGLSRVSQHNERTFLITRDVCDALVLSLWQDFDSSTISSKLIHSIGIDPSSWWTYIISLHNEPNGGVWNHRLLDSLLNHLFRRKSEKTSKLRVTGLCEGNSLVTSEFPAQRASNTENVSIWWRHQVTDILYIGRPSRPRSTYNVHNHDTYSGDVGGHDLCTNHQRHKQHRNLFFKLDIA